MEIKTTNDVWDDWRKYYLKSKPIRAKYIDKKWVAVDELKKLIEKLRTKAKRFGSTTRAMHYHGALMDLKKELGLYSQSNENKKEEDKIE